MSNLIKLKKFLIIHWLAILLVALGSWLRFAQLPEKGILFGDSGRDLLVAARAVESRELPLLGIPSSIPRFHQGPLTIWLSMVVYQLFGFKPIFFYWTFALIGCLSLLAIYEFSILTLNRKTGLIALAFLAVSPLAIAHSRMPYHTVPIALTAIIALWALTRVVERKKASLAVATFAVSLVFQHELSLFPLFLAIPICWWWGGILKNKTWLTAAKFSLKEIYLAGFALILGVLPQLISEIKDGSHQLSGFGLWLGYRIFSFFSQLHNILASALFYGIQTSLMYWTKFSSSQTTNSPVF
jgi:4-amino-4-deoxy-L-arabinose transferase-like glycosyltransferase